MLALSFLPDFDHEMSVTRLLLERVPDAALAWRPHDKAFTLGGLATHLAQIPRWGHTILDGAEYDLLRSSGRRPPEASSRHQVLEAFDEHVAALRKRLVATSDAELGATWTLMRGEQTLLSMPRIAALRRYLLHHMIHHRGQLSVYLRLRDVALPPLYGPSADEPL